MPKMILELDDLDYATIQKEIAYRQARSKRNYPDSPTLVPDGESCLAGALLAECIRDLDEYRDLCGNRED